jgi:hypothetical protein
MPREEAPDNNLILISHPHLGKMPLGAQYGSARSVRSHFAT